MALPVLPGPSPLKTWNGQLDTVPQAQALGPSPLGAMAAGPSSLHLSFLVCGIRERVWHSPPHTHKLCGPEDLLSLSEPGPHL